MDYPTALRRIIEALPDEADEVLEALRAYTAKHARLDALADVQRSLDELRRA